MTDYKSTVFEDYGLKKTDITSSSINISKETEESIIDSTFRDDEATTSRGNSDKSLKLSTSTDSQQHDSLTDKISAGKPKRIIIRGRIIND